jgi:hypothetical protein
VCGDLGAIGCLKSRNFFDVWVIEAEIKKAGESDGFSTKAA